MDLYFPDSERGEDLSTLSKSVDKSEAMFTMYLERSDEDDRKTTERWKRESNAILIFTGLFSTALASLIGISIQDLRPNSQDTSAFYLRNIYQLFANTTSPGSVIITIPTDPPKFSPPRYAILVNSLWFLSLAMSLTGALLAVFIQQWAHSYLHATQGRHTPHDRAQIRAFYAEGIDKLHLPRITGAVPVLIHVALFLFFSGLPIFLFNVDRTVFNIVITWMGLCSAGYACVTLMPIFCRDSPYYSPLSSSSWWCVTTAQLVINQLLKTFMSPSPDSKISRGHNARHSAPHHHWPSLRSMQKVAETFALKLSSDIDYRGLSWMFGTLNEDDEFEQFFDALPGLCDSEALEDPLEHFVKPNEKILSHALIGMMDRTLLSDMIPEPVKLRRIAVCTKAINVTSLLEPWWILRRVLLGDWDGFSKSVQFGLFVQDWKNMPHDVTAFYAQYIVSVAISNVQERDDRWFQLTSSQLNVSKSLVQTYLAYGDSVLLANVIFIVRRTINTYSRSADLHRSDILEALSRTLGSLCKFDILNTLPDQQREFCSLWNQLVEAVRNDSYPHMTSLIMMMLKSIQRLCITLHEGMGSFPVGFSITIDDKDPVLDDATWYPTSHLAEIPYFVPPLLLQSDESFPDTAGNTGRATSRSDATTPALSPGVLSVLRSSTPSPYPQSLTPSLTPSLTGGYSAPTYFTKPLPFHPPSAPPPHASQAQHTPQIHHDPPAHAFTPVITPESSSLSSQGGPFTPPGTAIRMPSPASSPSNNSLGLGGLGISVVPPADQTMPIVRVPSPESLNLPIPSQVLKVSEYGEYAGLLCHSPHSVLFVDKSYPTALHLFQARQFFDHRPDLADRIRQCESIEQVTAISGELADFTWPDWGNHALAIMEHVQYLKFHQHGDLYSLLLNTYPDELVYMEPGDSFWGDGAGKGMNELGKSLMRVRERLRAEADM